MPHTEAPRPRHPYAFIPQCEGEGDNCIECLREALENLEPITTENFGDYLNILAMAHFLRQQAQVA